MTDKLTTALRKAIKSSDKTVYQIAKEAGVTPIMISRFVRGERDIRLATAGKIADALGLELFEVE